MAKKTFLQLVNDVLVRLREDEVETVNQTAYTKLMGKYINDAKRQVEDAYNWNVLTETLTCVTSPGLFNYVLTGSDARFRVIDVIDDTNNAILQEATTKWMNQSFLTGNSTNQQPGYYNFNGVDTNGDTQVDLFPIPDGAYTIRFNIILPQAALVENGDKINVPDEPVVALAYAKALVERGEDGGMASSEAYQLYKSILSDYIAIESGRYGEEAVWSAV